MEEKVLFGVAIPSLVAMVLFLIAWRPWRRTLLASRLHVLVPIAFGSAFLLSFIAENGFPTVSTNEGWQWKLDRWEWIAPLVLVTIVCGAFASLRPCKKWHFALLTCIIGFTATKWMLLPELDTANLRLQLGLLVVINISLLNPIAVKRTGTLFPAIFMIIFSTTAGVVMQSGFAKLAIMSGALSATCGMAMLVGMFNRNFSIAHGSVMVLVVLSIVIMASGYAYDYSELNILCFILPVLAPLALWLGELSIVKNLTRLKANVVRLLIILIPCGIALAIAIIAGLQAASDDS